MGRATSKTERDSFWEERIIGTSHHKTTISDGSKSVNGRGNTSEKSQKVASEKWENLKSSEGSSNSGGSSSGGSSSSGGGICYLTTACMRSMNLPDNCFELSVLREFRDKVLLPTSEGRKAVKEYYRIAPEIVQAVEENGKDVSREVWYSVYSDIRKAVSLILRRDFDGAFKHYRQMTSRLKEKYLD